MVATLVELFVKEYNPMPMQIICKAIQDGFSPWDTGRIIAYQSDAINLKHSGIELSFEIETMREMVFRIYPNVLLDPIDMAQRVAKEAFRFYRYRPALPIDDHIILGEE